MTQPGAQRAAIKVQVQKAADNDGVVNPEYGMDEHVAALASRLPLLKDIGVDMVSSGIALHTALWPSDEAPRTIEGIAEKLRERGPARVSTIRDAALHAGADIALRFVLSWYQKMDLDVFERIRSQGKYEVEPELIAKRKARAAHMAEYANLEEFLPEGEF